MNRKAVAQCFPFTNLLVVFSITLCFSQYVGAEEQSDDGEHFDGSEYNASTFKDTNFEKENYRELRSTRTSGPVSKGADSSVTQDEHRSSKKPREEIGINSAGAEHGSVSKKKEGLTAQEKIPPVVDLPSDWVPDGVDLTRNGGFTTAPDNGSPVPYRLNGHIDIERGRP